MNNKIKMVHHGIANKNRQLEKMIDVLKLLDSRFTLDIYLTGSKEYISFLKVYSAGMKNVRILDPVQYLNLNEMLSKYDIGFFFNSPLTFNLRYSLPNKFFEFIQARLAIAIGPSPEMSRIVFEYRNGIVSKDFSVEHMAYELNKITVEELQIMKENSHKAAQELNFSKESNKIKSFLTFVS
jgi:hypothetical protein